MLKENNHHIICSYLTDLIDTKDSLIYIYIYILYGPDLSLAQKVNGLRPKKPKNNEFIENELKIWAKIMSWITSKADSNDKNRKID